jgi:hypothetical protein
MAPKVRKLDEKYVLDTFIARTWHQAKRNRFYYQDPKTGEFLEFNETVFIQYLSGEGFFKSMEAAVTKGKAGLSQEEAKRLRALSWKEFLHRVIRDKQVDWVGEIGGIPKGLYVDNGYRCLIEKGPVYVEPKEGDCSFLEKFMSQLFPGIQLYIMEEWIVRVYTLKQQDPHAPFLCQIPILVGDRDCGKSLAKDEIFIPLFGGRAADAISFITGSVFNSELIRADIGIIDDQNFDTRFDQDVTADRMKKWAADLNKRIEQKYQPAINVHAKIPLLVILNTGSKNLRLLPDLTEDIRDKVLAFLCGKAEVPTGKNHELEIQKIIRKELPAYLYRLLHKRNPPPGIVSKGRFGITSYYHPELLKMREEEDYAPAVLELVENYMALNGFAPGWSKTSGELFQELTADPDRRTALISLCRNPKALGWQLSKLTRIRPERVEKACGKHHSMLYKFSGEPVDPTASTKPGKETDGKVHLG